ncbi:MAG: hypothetical protein EZS28_042510, partial [Streblomastix strix]
MEPSNEQINEQTNEQVDAGIVTKRKYERKEGVKCGRPKKYNTIEEAKNKAREQRSAFKKKQYVIDKQFRQTITELQRTAIRQIQKVKLDEQDIITIINILDKYKQKQMKEIETKDEADESELIKMAYVSNATKRTLQDIAQKIGQQAMQQIGDYQSSKLIESGINAGQSQKQLDAITMRSIAYDILSDQLRVQQQTKFMTNYAVGVGDPSLIAITNVNAQIASDTGTRQEPMTQKMQRQVMLEQGNEKEKEQVYQQDKEQMTFDQIQELGNDVLLGVPPAPPLIGAHPEQLQIASLVQEDAQQQQVEDLQAQQMNDMNRAMNYKLGSMDWGKTPVNVSQFPSRDISMRI